MYRRQNFVRLAPMFPSEEHPEVGPDTHTWVTWRHTCMGKEGQEETVRFVNHLGPRGVEKACGCGAYVTPEVWETWVRASSLYRLVKAVRR